MCGGKTTPDSAIAAAAAGRCWVGWLHSRPGAAVPAGAAAAAPSIILLQAYPRQSAGRPVWRPSVCHSTRRWGRCGRPAWVNSLGSPLGSGLIRGVGLCADCLTADVQRWRDWSCKGPVLLSVCGCTGSRRVHSNQWDYMLCQQMYIRYPTHLLPYSASGDRSVCQT